jgi:autotransporter passenger strand-loop-strand repeat protein
MIPFLPETNEGEPAGENDFAGPPGVSDGVDDNQPMTVDADGNILAPKNSGSTDNIAAIKPAGGSDEQGSLTVGDGSDVGPTVDRDSFDVDDASRSNLPATYASASGLSRDNTPLGSNLSLVSGSETGAGGSADDVGQSANFEIQNTAANTNSVSSSAPTTQSLISPLAAIIPATPTTSDSGSSASNSTGGAFDPSLTVNASDPAHVTFTVGGLASNDHGTVTFTDVTGVQDVVSINSNGTYSANLSNLANGTIDYTLTVTDPSGHVTTVDPSTSLGTVAGFTLDANGWPVIPTQNGELIVYVSSSTGNDNNNGLTPGTAVASIAKGESLLKNGVPEELLLKAGDTFVNQTFDYLGDSGQSATAPLVIGSYGTGSAPIVETPDTGDAIGIGSLGGSGRGGDFLVIENIDFYAYQRDPNNPAYAGPTAPDEIGVRLLNPITSVALIGDQFSYYSTNIDIDASSTGASSTVTLYRNVVTDAYSTDQHSQGVYIAGIANPVIEQNVFDHNGWNATIPGAAATIFNHNLYLQYTDGPVVFTGNISADSATDGVMARTGGTITNNLFVNDAMGPIIGITPGSEPNAPVLTSAVISGNVILDSTAISASPSPLPRSQGVVVSNASGSGVQITDNIIADPDPNAATVNQDGINIDNYSSGIDAANNIIYGFAYPVVDTGTGDVTSPNAVNLTGYVNPNLSVASYNASQGGAASLAAFMAAADSQSMSGWNNAYTATAVDSYVQAGFATSVTKVIAAPTTGTELAGNSITITLDFAQTVTVTGTPTLSLNDGGTATYSGGSGGAALTFSYTVGASDSPVSALAISAVNLPNGASIDDQGGNPSNLANAVVTFPGLSIGTSAGPRVTAIVDSPASGSLSVGGVVTLTLDLSSAVTVNTTGGAPTVSLNDGGTASYTGGSGTSALTFSYTVAAGQSTTGLAATAVNLNGATMTDGSGNAANLALGGLTQSGPQISGGTTGGSALAIDGNGFSNVTSSQTSATVSLTTSQANDVLILEVLQNHSTVASVTDTAGLTWHLRAVAGTSPNTIYEYYAIAPSAVSNDVVTVNFAGSVTYADLNAFGVSGANTSSPFDPNASIAATPATSAGSVTTSNANDLIFAAYRFATNSNPNVGSGWTAINASGSYYLSEYQVASADQNGLAATASTTDENGGIVDAIMAASSSGGSSGIVVSGGNSPWTVSNGTTDTGDSIVSGGTEIVSSGGTTDSVTVSAGGTLEVLSGGTVSGATISSGGTLEFVSGASDSALTVLSGGTLDIGAGYTETGYSVANGVNLDVTSGGTVSGTTVLSGGALNVSSGGIAAGTTVSSGGHEFVSHGGHTSGTRVYAGGVETVSSGGVDGGTTLVGGTEYVMSGGVDPGTVVSSGGMDVVYGTTTDVTVMSGGEMVVSSGGMTSGTQVSAGGLAYVLSGGVDSGATLVGGTEFVMTGGTASGTVLSGGAEAVYGVATGTTVSSGGILYTDAGGATSGTRVSAGGLAYVLAGGVDSGTTVSSGGTQYVNSGGVADGTTLSNGSDEYVSFGGTAENTIVLSGGHGVAYSGSTVSGATISGGTLELQTGANEAGTFNFASAGMLTLDGTGTYSMLVAGFTSPTAEIDLTSINYTGATLSFAEASNNTSGTLTIANGASSASVLLLGNYVAGAASFTLEKDSGGGTIVFDPPVVAGPNPNGLATPHHS